MKTFFQSYSIYLWTGLIIIIMTSLVIYWERKAKRDERKRTDELKKEIDRLLQVDEFEDAISN